MLSSRDEQTPVRNSIRVDEQKAILKPTLPENFDDFWLCAIFVIELFQKKLLRSKVVSMLTGGYSLKKQTLDERQFHKKHLNLQHLLQVIDYGEHVFFKVKDTCAQRTWFAREDIRELEVLVARLRWLKEHVGLTVNRVTAIQTDLDSWQAEQVNRKFYYLSLLSVIFLPLSIITGVFGMNVGGVPWTGQKDPTLKHGFRNVLLICAAILVPFLSYFGTIIRNHGLTMKTEHTDFIRWPKWFLHISENFMESDASRRSYPSLKASPNLPE